MVAGVFQLLRERLDLGLLGFKLLVETDNLLGKFGHFGDLLAHNCILSLALFELKIDHADRLFFLANLLLAILQDSLLNVGLLVENTELVVPVNQLDTHVIARLAGVLILVDQVVHLFLQRIDDQVEFVSLVDQLANCGESRSELQFLAIELRSQFVTHCVGLDLLLVDVDQVVVFLGTFILQDVDFVLQDLDTLLHLGQVLTRRLNLTHVLVPRVLHLFVQSDECVQLEVCVLLLFRQIENEKLLDFELCAGLTSLRGRL